MADGFRAGEEPLPPHPPSGDDGKRGGETDNAAATMAGSDEWERERGEAGGDQVDERSENAGESAGVRVPEDRTESKDGGQASHDTLISDKDQFTVKGIERLQHIAYVQSLNV